jgi:5-methyltetrahydropteroyltriglutamate--homocysteine methyltransferase
MPPRNTPPFRADQVGSLLRPAAIAKARADRAANRIGEAELKQIEDSEIAKLIQKQESIGLKAVTDGEFRRAWWHFDFFGMLQGVDLRDAQSGIQFQGVQTKAQAPHIVGPLGFPADHPMLEHFRFLRAHARAVPKMTIPSPNVLYFRAASADPGLYPDRESLFAALASTWRQAMLAFYQAGCRYLQFDDTAWAYLCSPEEVERARQRGTDVNALPQGFARLINSVLDSKPRDMTITTHVCRGNFRSTWITSGGYEPVAEALLGSCKYDGFFLEYDSDRAGGFEPLRFLPKGQQQVVLGLVTTKTGVLESVDVIKRRIEEASRYVAPDQLCLSPQCGFASTEEGNLLAEGEQWAKLEFIVRLVKEVWGER